MNFEFIRYIVGWILNFQSIFLLVPCIVSMIYDEKSGLAFFTASAISLINETLEKLSQLTEAYLCAQLERGFSTLDFYKSLLI